MPPIIAIGLDIIIYIGLAGIYCICICYIGIWVI